MEHKKFTADFLDQKGIIVPEEETKNKSYTIEICLPVEDNNYIEVYCKNYDTVNKYD